MKKGEIKLKQKDSVRVLNCPFFIAELTNFHSSRVRSYGHGSDLPLMRMRCRWCHLHSCRVLQIHSPASCVYFIVSPTNAGPLNIQYIHTFPRGVLCIVVTYINFNAIMTYLRCLISGFRRWFLFLFLASHVGFCVVNDE